MLIFNQRHGNHIITQSSVDGGNILKNGGKSAQKTYKDVSKLKNIPNSNSTPIGEGSKNKRRKTANTTEKKKKISKKNRQFLEGLGLKIKQN